MTPQQQRRFWSKVDMSGGSTACWPWTGSRLPAGYGRFGWYYAHRTALILFDVDLPMDRLVCHRCDNPPCCNPLHLFVGTCRDNTLDAQAKGRLKAPPVLRGASNPRARLTDADVRSIRAAGLAGRRDGFVRMRRGSGVVANLAHRYGVSKVMIHNIIRGASWTLTPATEEEHS